MADIDARLEKAFAGVVSSATTKRVDKRKKTAAKKRGRKPKNQEPLSPDPAAAPAPEVIDLTSDAPAKRIKVAAVSTKVTDGDKPVKRGRSKSQKDAVVADILELQQELGLPLSDKRTLSKRTQVQLEKMLGDLMNEGSDKLMKKQAAALGADEQTASALCQLNYMIAAAAEKYSEQTAYDLTGYKAALLENEQQLMDVMTRIAQEHGEALHAFASATTHLIILNAACVGSVIKKRPQLASDAD